MSANRPPVVVTVDPAARQPQPACAADVLIAPPDHRPAPEYCADLLRRCPRASLVLVPDRVGGVWIATRAGEVFQFRLPDGARSADALRILAVMLFHRLTGGP